MTRSGLLAIALGASAIACVAAPFAVVGQSHAPKPKPLAVVTHSPPSASASVLIAEATPPPAHEAEVVHPHTFRVHDLATDSRYSVVMGTIGKRGFLGALAVSGLSPKESHRVLVGFSGVKNLDRLNASDTFSYAKLQDHIVAFELVPANAMEGDALEFFQEHEDDAATALVAKRVSLPIERKRVKVGVLVGADLRATLTSAGLVEPIATLVDDALDGHAELSDLHAGTRLRLVATEERIEGTFVSYAPIDAIEWTPSGKPAVRVYWFSKGLSEAADHQHTRHGGYYDVQGRQPYHGAWRSPIPMARISSRFNPNRMHPVLHVVMPHNGVDFAAPAGTPVYAAASGVIRSAGDGGPCGNMVQIEHPNGLISAYCHLSRFGPITPGEHVETRQLIGYVGQTGRATGPHLHFAVKRARGEGEVFIDPLSMRLDGVRIIPAKLRGDFDKTRQELDAEIDETPLPAENTAATETAQTQTAAETSTENE